MPFAESVWEAPILNSWICGSAAKDAHDVKLGKREAFGLIGLQCAQIGSLALLLAGSPARTSA